MAKCNQCSLLEKDNLTSTRINRKTNEKMYLVKTGCNEM